MTDSAVLQTLASKCGDQVRFFDLIDLTYLSRTKKLYLAVGKHALYLVKRSFGRVVTGGELFFMQIDKFIEDINKDTDVMLELNKQRNPAWTSDRLTITSMNRVLLLKYIHVAYVSDYMYRNGKATQFPHYRHKLSRSMEETELPQVQPFIDCQEVRYEGFFFYLHEDFEDRATAASKIDTGNYLDARGMEVAVTVHKPFPVRHLEKIGREEIRFVALAYKKALIAHVPCGMVLRSQEYIKKMNLSDDICQWTAWELMLRTPDYTVICLLLRRQYLPPTLDTAQDIALVFKISVADQQACHMSDDDFLKEVYFAADTLSPVPQNHVWYKEVVQAKLDALMFEEEGYRFLHLRLKSMPNLFAKAKVFLKSILLLLVNEGLLHDTDLIDELGPMVETDDSPMRVVLDVVKAGEGIDTLSHSGEQQALTNQWQMRVAHYFGFCIDKILLPGKFGLADVTDAIGLAGPKTDTIIRKVLEFLLHVRPKDMTQPFTGGSLVTLVEDGMKFQQEYIFNSRILKAMLEIGYLAKLFPKGKEEAYLKLMGILLRSPASPINLKTSVCRQVLKATTQIPRADLFTPLVPALVNVIRSRDAPSSSSYLASFALGTLVNLGAGSIPIKNMLINMGVAKMILSIIKTKDDDLIEHGLTLAASLTEQRDHKQRFMATGILHVLADMLTSEYNSPYYQKHKILRLVSTVVGQLAEDKSAKELLCVKYPALDCLVYMYHNSPAESDYKAKVMFALNQLAELNWQIKQRIGKHCIASCVTELRISGSEDYTETILNLLQVLASYKPNCHEMQASEIQDSLDNVSSIKVDTIFEHVRTLKAKIAKGTRVLPT